jgi:hypothetical protein
MSETLQLDKYSRRLFYSSTITVLSVYSAWYNELYYAMMRSLLVLSTSLIYWYNPTDGLRRQIDIISSNGCIGYQYIYMSRELPLITWIVYTITIMACIGCYAMARYYGRKYEPDFDMASQYHISIHILGNLGNIILYDGIGIHYINWNFISN